MSCPTSAPNASGRLERLFSTSAAPLSFLRCSVPAGDLRDHAGQERLGHREGHRDVARDSRRRCAPASSLRCCGPRTACWLRSPPRRRWQPPPASRPSARWRRTTGPILTRRPARLVQHARSRQRRQHAGQQPGHECRRRAGRVLFYDPRLSHNNGTSCASCHTQATGFGDPNQFSEGFEATNRAALDGSVDARYYRGVDNGRFFWDERAASLEDQVLMPIQDSVEMGSNLPDLVEELATTDFYPTLFNRAFGSTDVPSERMSQALRSSSARWSATSRPYDQALAAGTRGRAVG